MRVNVASVERWNGNVVELGFGYQAMLNTQ